MLRRAAIIKCFLSVSTSHIINACCGVASVCANVSFQRESVSSDHYRIDTSTNCVKLSQSIYVRKVKHDTYYGLPVQKASGLTATSLCLVVLRCYLSSAQAWSVHSDCKQCLDDTTWQCSDTSLLHAKFHPIDACVTDADYIFLSCGFFFLSSSSVFSSPNLSGRRLDIYHTSTHGVALVRT